MQRALLLLFFLQGCYHPDYITSQGVAVFLESEDWVDEEVAQLGIEVLEPARELLEDAFTFLIEEGPAILGLDESHIKHTLRWSSLYLRRDRFPCGNWVNCAGCRWKENRHAAKWYGRVELSPIFHEIMHSLRPGVPHRLKGEPDSPHDEWWDNQKMLNDLYGRKKT